MTRRRRYPIEDEFEHYLREAAGNDWAPKCAGRAAEFADYSTPPTPAEAEALCAGCPVLELCAEYAAATKPEWGVWAGAVWVFRKIVKKSRKLAS